MSIKIDKDLLLSLRCQARMCDRQVFSAHHYVYAKDFMFTQKAVLLEALEHVGEEVQRGLHDDDPDVKFALHIISDIRMYVERAEKSAFRMYHMVNYPMVEAKVIDDKESSVL